MEHAANQPTPPEEWTLDELAYLEEHLQEMFLTTNGKTKEESLRSIGAPNIAEWYGDQLARVQRVLDERGIPAHRSDRGVQIRHTGLTVIDGEVS